MELNKSVNLSIHDITHGNNHDITHVNNHVNNHVINHGINHGINHQISNDKDFFEKDVQSAKKIFDHSKKIELVKKINKIKKKDYLINIFRIINTFSKGYDINNNGVFIFFHNLPDEVYEQIENYVNNIYKLHKKSTNLLNLYETDFSESQIISSDTIEINNREINNDKELSNKEKLIMRRKKYEKYLNQNQN